MTIHITEYILLSLGLLMGIWILRLYLFTEGRFTFERGLLYVCTYLYTGMALDYIDIKIGHFMLQIVKHMTGIDIIVV